MLEGPYPYTGFKSVIDFRSARPPLTALGFYAFHVALCVALSSIVSAILGLILSATGMDYHQPAFVNTTMRAAEFGSIAYSLILYGLIIQMRGTWKNPLSLLILVLTFALAMIGGALLGIIPAGVTIALPEARKK